MAKINYFQKIGLTFFIIVTLGFSPFSKPQETCKKYPTGQFVDTSVWGTFFTKSAQIAPNEKQFAIVIGRPNRFYLPPGQNPVTDTAKQLPLLQLQLRDLEGGVPIELDLPGDLLHMEYAPNSERLLIAGSIVPARIIETQIKKDPVPNNLPAVILQNSEGKYRSFTFTPDSKQVVGVTDLGQKKVWDAMTGTEIKSAPKETDAPALRSVAYTKNGIIEVSDQHIISADDKKIDLPQSEEIVKTWSNPQSNSVMMLSKQGSLYDFDSRSGILTAIPNSWQKPPASRRNMIAYSYPVYNEEPFSDLTAQFYFSSPTLIRLQPKVRGMYNAQWAATGHTFHFTNENGLAFDYDSDKKTIHENAQTAFTVISTVSRAKERINILSSGAFTKGPVEPVCISALPKLEDPALVCETNEQGQTVLKPQFLKIMSEVEIQNICEKPFDAKEWKELFENPDPKATSISNHDLGIYLRQFQKPGGFDLTLHLPILVAALNANWQKIDPALMAGALQGVMASSNELYLALIKDYPALANMPASASNRSSCITPTEEQYLREKLISFLRFGPEQLDPSKPEQLLAMLKPVASLIRTFTKDRIKSSWNSTAAAFAYMLTQTKDFKNFEEYDLYSIGLLALDSIFNPDFNEPQTWYRLFNKYEDPKNRYQGFIFANKPIDNDPNTLTKYGYYMKKLKPFSSADVYAKIIAQKSTESSSSRNLEIKGSEVNWEVNGLPYRAYSIMYYWNNLDNEARFNKIIEKFDPAKTKIPERPDLKKMVDDKILFGAISGGNSPGGEDEQIAKAAQMDDYMDYYIKDGFRFSKISKNQLEALLKSETLDYAVHLGYERVYVSTYAFLGEKEVGGIKEKILLLYPHNDGRVFAPPTQLVIIDGPSEESASSVIENQLNGNNSTNPEIPEVISLTFDPKALHFDQRYPTFDLLDDLRSGKSYQEMKAHVSLNPAFQSPLAKEPIFPSDPNYQTDLLQAFNFGISNRGQSYTDLMQDPQNPNTVSGNYPDRYNPWK